MIALLCSVMAIRRECVDHFIVLAAHLRHISAPHPANLRSLLQSHQHALVIGQRYAGLSPRSADWIYQFTRNPWRASSPLRAGLGFRYTQYAAYFGELDKIGFPRSIPMLSLDRANYRCLESRTHDNRVKALLLNWAFSACSLRKPRGAAAQSG